MQRMLDQRLQRPILQPVLWTHSVQGRYKSIQYRLWEGESPELQRSSMLWHRVLVDTL